MTRTIILTLCSVYGFGQTTTLTLSGPNSTRPGTTVQLNLTLSTAGPAGLQWTLSPPSNWTATPTLGAAATAAQKDKLSCHNGLCLLYGLNQTTIQAGVVSTYQVQVPASAVAGQVSLPLTNVIAATGIGADLPISPGAVYVLRVLARSDIDGDGSTTAQDVILMDSQARGLTACTDDQNGDGACNIKDVVLVIVDYLRGLLP